MDFRKSAGVFDCDVGGAGGGGGGGADPLAASLMEVQ
jgi:hypothetical protein